MIVWSENNGARTTLSWAHHDGTRWTNGTFGAGSLTAARLIAWTDRFVFTWQGPTGSRQWAIHRLGTWTTPSAAAPAENITANDTRLLELTVSSIFPYAIVARFYDGTTWTTPAAIASDVTVAVPLAAGTGNTFALIYGDVGSPYVSLVLRHDGTSWTGPFTIANHMGFPGGFSIATNGAGYVASSGNAPNVLVFDPTTSNWSNTPLGGTLARVTGVWRAGNGYLAAYTENSSSVRLHDGTGWLPTTTVLNLGTAVSPRQVDSDGSRILLAAYDYNTNRPVGRVYDGSWSAPFSGTANATQLPQLLTGAGLVGTDGLVTYLANGEARALTYRAGTWMDLAPLQSGAVSNGGLLTLKVAGALAASFSDGKPYVARTLTAGAVGPPTVLRTSTLDGHATNVRLAFAPGGRGLAAWEQYDNGVTGVFAAHFDRTWQPAFRVVADGRTPRVATNGSSFVISWSTSDTSGSAQWVAHDVPGAGLGAPVRLTGAVTNVEYVAPEVASAGTGYSAVWTRAATFGTRSVNVSVSADGTSWSPASEVLTPTNWSALRIAGRPAGYLITATASGSTATRSLSPDGGIAPGSSSLSGTSCESAAGPTSFGVLCATTGGNMQSQIFSGGTWGPAVLTTGTLSLPLAIASARDSYRIAVGSQTRVSDGGTWAAPLAVTGMAVTSMTSDGTEFVGVGLRTSGGFPSIGLSRSVGGAMQDVGVIETIDSTAEAPFCAFGGDAGVWAVWPQDDPGRATRVILGKNL